MPKPVRRSPSTARPGTPFSPADNLEQSTESADELALVDAGQMAEINALADQLAERLDGLPGGELVGDMIANALKLLRDRTSRGDLKLINKSFKELRYALKVFAPYRRVRKVSIFGSARTPEDHGDYVLAADFGKAMAERGWMVITGAGGGIMAAGHGGAGTAGSFGLAIRLPFEQATNRYIENDPKLVNFKYFFTRKLMFVRSSHAIALFPGGFGTMDEGFEVLTLIQTGKSVPMPLVLMDPPGSGYWRSWQRYVEQHLLKPGLISDEDLALFKRTHKVDEAVEEVCAFYRNYHSLRYVREKLVIRLAKAPSDTELKAISRDFASIVSAGDFEVTGALPVESDEPGLAELPRLVFSFNRRNQGKLRQLINRLNEMA